MATAVRLGALALGLSCAGLGAFGAYEFTHRLEGEVTYLVLAAPLIAVTAALIPPIAETTWRSGHPLKALLWWAVLVPAAAVVFFSAAERVHVAKAGAQAERSALRGAAVRAQAALTKAEVELAKARADANKARGQKKCGSDCRTKLEAEASAHADVEAARRDLLLAERSATTDSPLQAPVWLLPAALDLVAFMAIWTGLSQGSREGAPRGACAEAKAACDAAPNARYTGTCQRQQGDVRRMRDEGLVRKDGPLVVLA
jgi:hypothetical protein